MKMAIKNGDIILAGWTQLQYNVIMAWNKVSYHKATKTRPPTLVGPCDLELLTKLSQLITLPAPAEAIRQRLNAKQDAINRMRKTENVKPLIEPPVKADLFQHQIRGYNMALIAFDLVEVKAK